MMPKFLIETNEYIDGKRLPMFRSLHVFKPGWYGNYPYFHSGDVIVDNLGTHHMELNIANATDEVANGMQIGRVHVPLKYTKAARLVCNAESYFRRAGGEEEFRKHCKHVSNMFNGRV